MGVLALLELGADRDLSDAARLLGCRPKEVHLQAALFSELRCVYLRNPKVANSTILQTLGATKEQVESGIRDNPGALAKALRDPAVFKFTFVRNPYSRVLSAYLDKIVRCEKRGNAGLPAEGDVTLLEFLEAIRSHNPRKMNRHWRPQSVQVSFPADFIGKLERFDEDFAFVMRELGIEGVPVNTKQEERTNARDRLRDYIGLREKALIDEIYAVDFERFGYERRLPE